MIGDGMAQAHLDAASSFRHGARDRLVLQTQPLRASVITSSLSGTTDSAAAATAISTGARVYNGQIAIDHGVRVENLIELAHRHRWAAGVVTSTTLADATPAAFSAHGDSRRRLSEIARVQANESRPEIMLGAGTELYAPLLPTFAGAGYAIITNRDELRRAAGSKILGLFAHDELPARGTTSIPTLAELAEGALRRLDASADSFFLLVEGSLIDTASHSHDLERVIDETLAFDDAVAVAMRWAASREDVTMIVTADHECGGLAMLEDGSTGVLPRVAWNAPAHTNAVVPLFARGPGTEPLSGVVMDHTDIHRVLRARITGEPVGVPARELVPDGRLDELAHSITGAGRGRIEALRIDADERVLALGIKGSLGAGSVVVLIDIDFGAGTGLDRLDRITDRRDGAASLLASLLVRSAVPGFGADLAIVVAEGRTPSLDELGETSGLRGLRPPFGTTDRLGWFALAANRGTGGDDLEAHVPWTSLVQGQRAPLHAAIVVLIVRSTGDVEEVFPGGIAPRANVISTVLEFDAGPTGIRSPRVSSFSRETP